MRVYIQIQKKIEWLDALSCKSTFLKAYQIYQESNPTKMPAAKNTVTLEQINALQSELAALRTDLSSLTKTVETISVAPASVSSGKAKKERKPRNPDAKPNAWIVFTSRVREILGNNGYSKGVEVTQFCSSICVDKVIPTLTDAEILAARASWTRPAQSKQALEGKSRRKNSSGASVASDGASVTSAPTAAAPAKAARVVLSDEEKKARRNEKARLARAAKKAAEAVAAPAVAAPVASAHVVAAPVASAPVAAAADASEETWIAIPHKGKRIMYNPANNHCYYREADGSQGDWAGLYYPATKTLDVSVEEPVEDDDEVDLDEE